MSIKYYSLYWTYHSVSKLQNEIEHDWQLLIRLVMVLCGRYILYKAFIVGEGGFKTLYVLGLEAKGKWNVVENVWVYNFNTCLRCGKVGGGIGSLNHT